MSHLSLECLEPRYLLSSIVVSAPLDVPNEARETPALIWENECITTEIAGASLVSGEDQTPEDASDGIGQPPCMPDGDAGDVQRGSASIEHAGSESTESLLEQQDGSEHAEFRANALSPLAGGELNSSEAAPPDAAANPGVVIPIPQPVAVSPPAIASRPPDTALANAGYVSAVPAARPQLPVYFSGATEMRGARWKASAEKLVDADSLFDVIDRAERDGISSPDAIVSGSRGTAVLAVSAAVATQVKQESVTTASELAHHSAVFSQVERWTKTDEPPASSRVSDPLMPGDRPAERLIELPLPPALDAEELPKAMTRSGRADTGASELTAANVAMPLGRVQGWCLLGGVGLWQVILSARTRQRKQSGEKQPN